MDPAHWSREQTIIAFNLYCKIPFQKAVSVNPDVIETAKIIGRSPGAVAMKLGNFGSFDPELKKRNISGLTNTSKLDKEIWEEFNKNWERLAFESEKLIAQFSNKKIEEISEIVTEDLPEGKEREATIMARVNQAFFRRSVMAAYNNTCCITGIKAPQLLIASHIIPWSKDPKIRLNPKNGLSLNALHDRAFDKGLITITPDFKVKVSENFLEKYNDKSIIELFRGYQGKKIILPERFTPQLEFLEYHNKHIYEKV